MHTITKSPVLGLSIVRPQIFKDYRGEYTEIYNHKEVFPDIDFVQNCVILSHRGVLRGFHGDIRTNKLISCLHGAFQITFACIDPNDGERFGKTETMILDDKERLAVLLPNTGFVNAHQCLTETCLFFYQQDTYYLGVQHQYSIRHNLFQTTWPIEPILSKRDSMAHELGCYLSNTTNGLRLCSPEEIHN